MDDQELWIFSVGHTVTIAIRVYGGRWNEGSSRRTSYSGWIKSFLGPSAREVEHLALYLQ